MNKRYIIQRQLHEELRGDIALINNLWRTDWPKRFRIWVAKEPYAQFCFLKKTAAKNQRSKRKGTMRPTEESWSPMNSR